MSYMSGIMMGMSLGNTVRQFFAGGGQSLLGLGGQSFLGGMGGRGGMGGGRGGMGGGQSFFGGQSGGGRSQSFFGGQGGRGGQEDSFSLKDLLPGQGSRSMTLASATPGRRRYNVGALVQNQPLAEAVTSALPKIDWIDEVKVNPATGSLLILYHGSETAMDALMEQLARRVFNAGGGADQEDRGETTSLAAVGRSLRNTTAALSRKVSAMTNGWFDLPSLLSLFFTIQGVQKLLIEKQVPSGPQMLWWAYSLLRGWRFA